jgi:hypothetical protein
MIEIFLEGLQLAALIFIAVMIWGIGDKLYK